MDTGTAAPIEQQLAVMAAVAPRSSALWSTRPSPTVYCSMASPEATRLLQIARRDLKMARRLLDPEVEEASWGWAAQQGLEKTLKTWLNAEGVQPAAIHVFPGGMNQP
jgi:hypothetical protein